MGGTGSYRRWRVFVAVITVAVAGMVLWVLVPFAGPALAHPIKGLHVNRWEKLVEGDCIEWSVDPTSGASYCVEHEYVWVADTPTWCWLTWPGKNCGHSGSAYQRFVAHQTVWDPPHTHPDPPPPEPDPPPPEPDPPPPDPDPPPPDPDPPPPGPQPPGPQPPGPQPPGPQPPPPTTQPPQTPVVCVGGHRGDLVAVSPGLLGAWGNVAGWPFVLAAADSGVVECQLRPIVGVDRTYPGHARWPSCAAWVAAEPGVLTEEDCPGGLQLSEDGRWVLFGAAGRCTADPYGSGCRLGASWEDRLDRSDAACGRFSSSSASCVGFAPPGSGWYWVQVEAVDEDGEPVMVDPDPDTGKGEPVVSTDLV